MKNSIQWVLFGGLIFVVNACNNNDAPVNTTSISITKENVENGQKIDPMDALQTWKNDLLEQKQLGGFADFEDINSKESKDWKAKYPNQLDGLPEEDEFEYAWIDLNNDQKEDLLMYFQSENYSGHNGDSPSFARVVYSDGQIEDSILFKIKSSILESYKAALKTDPTLREVTDNYLNQTLSIDYDKTKGIHGEFELYTVDDAHCCPSYEGEYQYDMVTNQATIIVEKNMDTED